MPIKQVKYVFINDISNFDAKGKKITSFLFVMDRINKTKKEEEKKRKADAKERNLIIMS
jgi:hypothetical protein